MGYVRTNAPTKLGGGGGGGGSGTQDLPTHPSSISANGGNNHVTLTLEYSSTDLVDGVQINYKLDGYPTSPTDGEFVTENGAATTIKIEGLTNSLTYYFRAFLYNEVDGVKYFQTDITNAQATCIPRAVEITGIIPLVSAADHIVIVESCAGTISMGAGTTIILGSGGQSGSRGGASRQGGAGGGSGYVNKITIPSDINAQSFTATIASAFVASGTKLTIGASTYDCGSTSQTISSKWGPIGGVGGAGGTGGSNTSSKRSTAGSAGTGAGGGGGAGGPHYYGDSIKSGGAGGNASGYGNKGLSGSRATWGSSSNDGGNGGDGGKGGYAAGGGGGGGYGYEKTTDDSATTGDVGNGGAGGTGIIVIQWDK